MILVLLTAFILQGGTAETSGPDRELLARGRWVGERFRDAVNSRDIAAFRNTFAPALQEAWDSDEVARDLDDFRHLRGKALSVKQARRFGDGLIEVRLATERCGATLLRLGLDRDGRDGKVESFAIWDEPSVTP